MLWDLGTQLEWELNVLFWLVTDVSPCISSIIKSLTPKIVVFPYSRMKICASQKTAVLKGLHPSNSNRQASFRKTMSACSQLFLGYVHGGIVAIQPPKSLRTKPNAPFFASTLCSLLSKIYQWMRWDRDMAVSLKWLERDKSAALAQMLVEYLNRLLSYGK